MRILPPELLEKFRQEWRKVWKSISTITALASTVINTPASNMRTQDSSVKT
jgi:hypothetical protein